jgi:hypothetical protein
LLPFFLGSSTAAVDNGISTSAVQAPHQLELNGARGLSLRTNSQHYLLLMF